MPSLPSNGDHAARMDRRLAAIAFIDIVGYSILMGRDETGTLAVELVASALGARIL